MEARVQLLINNFLLLKCNVFLFVFQTEPCKKKVNPFKFGLPKTSLISSTEKDLLKILHTVPALGDAKARLLLEKLPTLQEIATAEQVKLAKIIGKGPANAVFDFFHHE